MLIVKGKEGWVWVLLEPLRIIHNNKLVFFSIASFTTLPLSFLLFTLSISTYTLHNHIYHVEALARFTSTLMEARHVSHESRDNVVYLFRIRSFFYLLCLPLSLAAVVSSVYTTHTTLQGKTFTLTSALKNNWKRPFITVIFVYVILMAFSPVLRVIATLFFSHETRFLIMVIGSVFEVYLMAVMGLGLVVSIVEDRFGWDAICVGSGVNIRVGSFGKSDGIEGSTSLSLDAGTFFAGGAGALPLSLASILCVGIGTLFVIVGGGEGIEVDIL
uniref:Uncharacterized protein LOC101509400 n=1 Tax=Cicer arietinum TaxID=3827 RepID=A0A1S2Y0I4_CICAR|nr:uncharacterized protein LOC101509400 [Cicer arietinum]